LIQPSAMHRELVTKEPVGELLCYGTACDGCGGVRFVTDCGRETYCMEPLTAPRETPTRPRPPREAGGPRRPQRVTILLQEIEEALDYHELIKVRLVDPQDRKKDLANEIAQRSGGTAWGWWKRGDPVSAAPRPEKRKVECRSVQPCPPL